MDEEEFESWFVPSPRRLHTLNAPKHVWRLVSLILAACAGLSLWVYLVLR